MTERTCSICIRTVICTTLLDVETYDQIALNADVVGDALKFVKENETVKICSHNGNVFSVEPSAFCRAGDYRNRAGI